MINVNTLVEEEVRSEIFQPFITSAQGGEVIVEVGTFVGGNLCRVGELIKHSTKDIKLIGVDDFHFVNISNVSLSDAGLHFGEYDTRQESFYQTLLKNLDAYVLSNLVQLIDSDSIEASKLFQNNSIDLLFLDANHSYPYTTNELKAWIPKVKNGGIISGHDWPCDGIQMAVKENLSNNDIKITSTNGAYWTIKK